MTLRTVAWAAAAALTSVAAFGGGLLTRDLARLGDAQSSLEQRLAEFERARRALAVSREERSLAEHQYTEEQKGVLALLAETRRLKMQNLLADRAIQPLRVQLEEVLGKEMHVVVDLKRRRLAVRRGAEFVSLHPCAVGKGGMLVDKTSGRTWEFQTPRGVFAIRSKTANPVWFRPDWAFVEDGKPVPQPDDPSRRDPTVLGRYAMDLGWGYKIHGTPDELSLGRPVSHGCIRMGAEDLDAVYHAVKTGARVFIF